MKKKILVIFGTRPEAIKIFPVIKELKINKNLFNTKICITDQHTDLLEPILNFFKIKADYRLNIMKKNQDLFYLTAKILNEIQNVLKKFNPDYAIVHGDTTTTLASSIACFYNNSKILHVEAGLRTFNFSSPFPEEFNRVITSKIAYKHYCPTKINKKNLIKEGVKNKNLIVTGNTSIDSIKYAIQEIQKNENKYVNKLIKFTNINFFKKKYILITVHRRENHGKNLDHIFKAIKKLSKFNKCINFIYPVHPNPNVKIKAKSILGGINNVFLVKPLEYELFVYLMKNCFFVISDSGGLQEEAPYLRKPLVLIRDTTERPEAFENGNLIMVGSNLSKIFETAQKLINDKLFLKKFSKKNILYGNGNSAKKIVSNIIKL